MDENQSVIEVVKLLSKSNSSHILSDLIKVGIPSLVAIISGLVTYKISKNNANANIQIAELSHAHDKDKIYRERRHDNLNIIANGVTSIYEKGHRYLLSIAAVRMQEERNKEVSSHLREDMTDKYIELDSIKNEHLNNAISLGLLFGDRDLISKLDEYDELITEIQSSCSFDTELPYLEISKFTIKLKKVRDDIFIILRENISLQ